MRPISCTHEHMLFVIRVPVESKRCIEFRVVATHANRTGPPETLEMLDGKIIGSVAYFEGKAGLSSFFLPGHASVKFNFHLVGVYLPPATGSASWECFPKYPVRRRTLKVEDLGELIECG